MKKTYLVLATVALVTFSWLVPMVAAGPGILEPSGPLGPTWEICPLYELGEFKVDE